MYTVISKDLKASLKCTATNHIMFVKGFSVLKTFFSILYYFISKQTEFEGRVGSSSEGIHGREYKYWRYTRYNCQLLNILLSKYDFIFY